MASINRIVMMSGADYFSDEFAINPFMDSSVPIDIEKAQADHAHIQGCLEQAGVKVIQIAPPKDCQDGVYAANWALCRRGKAVLARLPDIRQTEMAHAEKVLKEQGLKIIRLPEGMHFSGQGDALPCGNYLFMGQGYRTDPAAHRLVGEALDYEVISLQTVPALDHKGQPRINSITGWPDSFFYDLDLALAVLTKNLIAWCPEAFLPDSQAKIRGLPLEKIEVSLDEALHGFACNLVSTGETVVMSAHAPLFKAAVEARGLQTITPEVDELSKGGGFIRCTSLTLDND